MRFPRCTVGVGDQFAGDLAVQFVQAVYGFSDPSERFNEPGEGLARLTPGCLFVALCRTGAKVPALPRADGRTYLLSGGARAS